MKQNKLSPYTDCNGRAIYEGDTVKGVGKHVGQSEVFFKHGVWQPFSFLNDHDGDNFLIVKNDQSTEEEDYDLPMDYTPNYNKETPEERRDIAIEQQKIK